MTLFSGQVYGGVGQLGAHNKVAAAGDVLIFNDTFTDADTTLLTAHTPELGGPWSADGTSAVITSNEAGTGGLAADRGNRLALGKANIKITADVRCSIGSGTPRIYFRVKTNDANNWRDNYYVTFDSVKKLFYLRERINGTDYTRASSACNFTGGQVYAAEITADGNDIVAVCNGVTLTYSSSSNSTNTYFYFYVNKASSGLDNLKIYDLG